MSQGERGAGAGQGDGSVRWCKGTCEMRRRWAAESTVPGFLATWKRGRVDAAVRRGIVAAAANVPGDFSYDGRLMTPAEFLAYVRETNIAWAWRG